MTTSIPDNENATASRTDKAVVCDALVLPLELAFIRWSVVHRRWHEMANDMPLLQAFLAGWCCRCIGTTAPENVGIFRASFFAGWREADDQITIASRQNTCDDARPLGAVASGALFEETAGKTSVNSKLQ